MITNEKKLSMCKDSVKNSINILIIQSYRGKVVGGRGIGGSYRVYFRKKSVLTMFKYVPAALTVRFIIQETKLLSLLNQLN